MLCQLFHSDSFFFVFVKTPWASTIDISNFLSEKKPTLMSELPSRILAVAIFIAVQDVVKNLYHRGADLRYKSNSIYNVTDSQTLSLHSELVVSLRPRDYFDWT